MTRVATCVHDWKLVECPIDIPYREVNCRRCGYARMKEIPKFDFGRLAPTVHPLMDPGLEAAFRLIEEGTVRLESDAVLDMARACDGDHRTSCVEYGWNGEWTVDTVLCHVCLRVFFHAARHRGDLVVERRWLLGTDGSLRT